jgi:hypothetical protein
LCALCGLIRDATLNTAEVIADFGFAQCSQTLSCSHLGDLQDVPNTDLTYQRAHVDMLAQLLQNIESGPVDESSGDLEKRISSSKLLPKKVITHHDCGRCASWRIRAH